MGENNAVGFHKDTCDNRDDAEKGFQSLLHEKQWFKRTALAAPLTPGTCPSQAVRKWYSWFISMMFWLVREGGENKKCTRRLKIPLPLAWINNMKTNGLWPLLQTRTKKDENWSIYLTLPDTIPILTSYNVRKSNAVILPISVMDYESYVWSVLWSSTSIESYSPELCSSGVKWCSHLVDSGFESRYKKAAMEKTTPASIAYHKPWESCKSQFTEQTPSNNCREKQVCSTGKCEVIDSASGKGKSAHMNRLYPGEPYLMWSLLSMKWNSIFNDTKLKEAARRRWHPQHCHLQSVAWRAIKVACSLNSLSCSFLTTSLPLCLSPHLSWQVLRFLQSWVFICMWLSSTGTCLWEDRKGEKDQKQLLTMGRKWKKPQY